MLVAKIVVETLPGKALVVAEQMGRIQRMGLPSPDGDHRVVAVWRVHDSGTLEGLAEVLHALSPEILEVYPTLLGEELEEE
jgi:hypothetical protein